jgi:hypothetical protein
LYPKPHIVDAVAERAAATFEALRAIEPEDFFSEGRVYGGGLYKMEPAELMRLPANGLAELLEVKLHRQPMLF